MVKLPFICLNNKDCGQCIRSPIEVFSKLIFLSFCDSIGMTKAKDKDLSLSLP